MSRTNTQMVPLLNYWQCVTGILVSPLDYFEHAKIFLTQGFEYLCTNIYVYF